MDRRFTEFLARNGPLFRKPRRIDRLNFEDTTLMTHKWTTNVCNGDLEALPIIVEKDENELSDGEGVPAGPSAPVRAVEITTPILEEPELIPIDSLSSSFSTTDLSCIFTNTAHSVQSFRDAEFETMYNNAAFSSNPRMDKRVNDSFDSSSDEELDNYFKFRISLPTRKFGKTGNLQAVEAKTELIDQPEGEPKASIPTTSKAEEVAEAKPLQEAATPSECEVVVATMEADFSDARSEENLSLFRRISQPLSLRYSSEEVEDTVKVLSHTTSFMNFVTDQVRGIFDEVPILEVDDSLNQVVSSGKSLKGDPKGRIICEGEVEKEIKVVENVEPGLKLSSSTTSSSVQSTSQQLERPQQRVGLPGPIDNPINLGKSRKKCKKGSDGKTEDTSLKK